MQDDTSPEDERIVDRPSDGVEQPDGFVQLLPSIDHETTIGRQDTTDHEPTTRCQDTSGRGLDEESITERDTLSNRSVDEKASDEPSTVTVTRPNRSNEALLRRSVLSSIGIGAVGLSVGADQSTVVSGEETTAERVFRNPYDTVDWDEVLHQVLPERNVLGFANDDTHGLGEIRHTGNVFPLENLDTSSVRSAMEDGRVTFWVSWDQEMPEATIEQVTVDG